MSTQDFRDSLSSEPVSSTLKRLHNEANESDKSLLQLFEDPQKTPEETISDFIKQEEENYKELYHKFSSNFLSVSTEFGVFLYSLVRTTNAKRIVEFGTSFGISAIYLAAGLRDNGGGELISTELEETKAVQARKNFTEAGLSDLIEVRIGDALETLTTGIEGKIDLVHLDGAFSLYLPVLKLLEPHLRTGTLVVGENSMNPAYLEYIRNPLNGYYSTRIQVGVGKENIDRGNELSVVIR